MMLTEENLTFPNLQLTSIEINKQVKFGYSWMSKSGNRIFARAGSEHIIGGRFRAELFILDSQGEVLKKIGSGWLPR